LDSSFKVGAGANGAVDALVLQADQRILVGGEFTTVGGCSNSYLARLSADGAVDASFNPAGQTDGSVQCLLQQPDGKVLVAGSFTHLVGQPRRALARLLPDGSIDAAFDASGVLSTNSQIFSLALQADGRLLVGYTEWDERLSQVVRLHTNGAPDPTFVCTNIITSYLFTLLPLPDGGVLCGGNPGPRTLDTHSLLFRLKPNGEADATFDARLELSSVFCLLKQPNGQILVGGLLNRIGASKSIPLLRLNADLQWDETFQSDLTDATGRYGAVAYSLLPQPGGKLLVGGNFAEVGGYWRRNIVRLNPQGHVDGCWDPGLGLGESPEPGPVRAMVLQPDGRILIGGQFQGCDTAYGQRNLARLLSQSDCDLIRVYLNGGQDTFAAATFPPGGTNFLEGSDDLRNWQTVETDTRPYLWRTGFTLTDPPRAFFRARQAR
jgi:uncharacterized delta-60 repeat protein